MLTLREIECSNTNSTTLERVSKFTNKSSFYALWKLYFFVILVLIVDPIWTKTPEFREAKKYIYHDDFIYNF